RGPVSRRFVTVVKDPAARRFDHLPHCFIVLASEQAATRRNECHPLSKCVLQVIEITINIGMVEFDAGKNDVMRPIVQKLRALVEEGAVVLIPFQDHMVSASRIPPAAEVERHATDKETWIQAPSCQYPCSQSGGGGFPMGASDD